MEAVRKSILLLAVLLIVVILATQDCFAQAAGFMGEDKTAVDAQIDLLHEELNAEQYEAIYDNASPSLKQSYSREGLIEILKKAAIQFGKFERISDRRYALNGGVPVRFRVTCLSVFQKGEFVETFTFVKLEDGPKLATWEIGKGKVHLINEEAESCYSRGMASISARQYDRAIDDFTRAIALEPNYSAAYLGRAVAFKQKGDNDKAIADYTQVIRLSPGNTKTFFDRGVVYGLKGDANNAIGDFTIAIRFNPQNAQAYYNRGTIYVRNGEDEKAIADFNATIGLSPNFSAAYYNRGVAYDRQKNYDQALSDYNKAIELSPRFPLHYFSKGLLLEKMKNKKEARLAYQEFLKRADVTYANYIDIAEARIAKLGH